LWVAGLVVMVEMRQHAVDLAIEGGAVTFLIDCSHYQGAINWSQVAGNGCAGAYIKVTDGAGGVDANWQANHAGARAAGLPVGPYHFAEGGDAQAEATHFASTWSAGWQLHPVLDYEIGSANSAWLTEFRVAFRQKTGFDPFRVYAAEGMLTGQLNPSGWIDGDTTIWAARYASSLGWNHPALVLWQNTDAANVPGVVGNVDEDQFMNGWTPAGETPGNEGEVANTIMSLTVDQTKGRAYAVLTEGSNSGYFSQGWLSLTALYGGEEGITGARITYLNDDGTHAGDESVDVAWNKRWFQQMPDGVGIVTVDWTPATDGTILVGAVELASK
jgi:GH25 family lysozyme M1 (1,4-beta-N-acetylmuramidase)